MNWLESLSNALFPPNSYGCLSLLPPLIAIVLAIATRRVVLSLLAGVFTGSLVLANGNPVLAIASTLETHLWTSLSDSLHLRVFVFTILMGAMIGVMQRSGGMEAIVNGIAPLARSRRGGQLTVWLLGMIMFFDDYANSLLLGNTMRPLTDRLRISREKLAYLVDSTAAPVSGLALVSTWVAGEIGFIQEAIDAANLDIDAFSIFLASIPYRFYVLLALIFVPLVGLLRRDFGPMLSAERQALQEQVDHTDNKPDSQRAASHWVNAVVPVLGVVAVTIGLILLTGKISIESTAKQNTTVEPEGAEQTTSSAESVVSPEGMENGEATPPSGESLAEADSESRSLINVFGSGDSYLSLLYGSLAGLLLAMGLAKSNADLNWTDIRQAAIRGAGQVAPALVILWLAWALSRLTNAEFLNTGAYLGALLQDTVAAAWLPTMIFVIAGIVAFSTGTSWGTMGILMPLVVPTVVRVLGSDVESVAANPILIGSIGGVLAGAIFGDHCSPISDTTVLSSQASGCNHIAHVRTQLPYALAVAVVSIVCGTLPLGFGVSVWLLLPIGVVALVICLLLVGKSAEAHSQAADL